MTHVHTIHTAEDFIDPVAHFELWPFTRNTGCPVSDIHEPHMHDFFVVHFVEQGSGAHVVDFQPYDIVPDTFYFAAPQQLHLWRTKSELTGHVMAFTEDFLRAPDSPITSIIELDFFHSLAHMPLLHTTPEQAKELRELLSKMSTEFNAKNAGYVSVLQAYFHIFMVTLKRLYTDKLSFREASREPDMVRRFKKLVTEKHASQMSVQEYADELGVSVSRLNAVVKDVTRTTPGQIVRNELVMAAKRLLAHSEMSVSEICFKLSFEDPSYFGRFFKREAGITPSAFRDQMREKYQHFAR